VTPEVSVCLTACNRGAIIAETIQSILEQECGNFELLIGDDASADNTDAVCREYAARDGRIRYFRHGTNLGMPGNLNFLIRRASASLVANLHDGDVYRKDLLSQWKRALDDQPDAAFVWNHLKGIDSSGNSVDEPVIMRRPDFPERIEVRELVEFMLRDFRSPVWGTVMARAACYRDVGLFNARYGFISDVEMWMRLNLHYPVAYIREPLITLRAREIDTFTHVNWERERALVAIHEDIAHQYHKGDPVTIAKAVRDIRRRKDMRWMRHLGSCLRRRKMDLYRQGVRMFYYDDSPVLKVASIVGAPFMSIPAAKS